jgi:glutathione S-transferase
MPILYSHYECGHCYKVGLTLNLMQVAFEQRAVDLNRLRELRNAEFRKVARFEEVPVLVLDDGLAVCQSNTILDTLARRYERLDGHTDAQKVQVREWLAWESGRLALSLPYVRASRHFTPLAPALETWFSDRLQADLNRLNHALDGAQFLVAGGPTIADVSCCSYLFWAHQARIDLDKWPWVQAWLGRLRALPGWRAPYDLLEPRHPILTGIRT